jgi:hypothetical protein
MDDWGQIADAKEGNKKAPISPLFPTKQTAKYSTFPTTLSSIPFHFFLLNFPSTVFHFPSLKRLKAKCLPFQGELHIHLIKILLL